MILHQILAWVVLRKTDRVMLESLVCVEGSASKVSSKGPCSSGHLCEEEKCNPQSDRTLLCLALELWAPVPEDSPSLTVRLAQ